MSLSCGSSSSASSPTGAASASPAKEARRTPSRRTGRGGSYARSSSSAIGQTTSGSLVGLLHRLGPRDVGPVVEADLDPDRAPLELLLRETATELLGLIAERLLECRQLGHVDVEGRLHRLRFGLASDADRRLVAEVAALVEPGAGAAPNRASRSPRSHSPSAASVVMPSFSSRSTVFGPIPGTTPGGPRPAPSHPRGR